MSTFNQVTESCFIDCVNDFTARRLTKQEVRYHNDTAVEKLLTDMMWSALHEYRSWLDPGFAEGMGGVPYRT